MLPFRIVRSISIFFVLYAFSSYASAQNTAEEKRDTGVAVQVHDRIAMVWAPYDLWVNDKFSHSGVDVFTLLKTAEGWKISSCSYTVEKK